MSRGPKDMDAAQVKKIVYVVNGQVVGMWYRIRNSKLTWVIVAFVLAEVYRWYESLSTPTPMDLDQVWLTVKLGVIGILLRSAMGKMELANNANNPNLPEVKAVPYTSTKRNYSGPLSGLFVLAICLSLTACNSVKSKAPVCITNPDGSTMCYNPPPEPPLPPPPPPVMVQAQQPLTVAPPTLEK